MRLFLLTVFVLATCDKSDDLSFYQAEVIKWKEEIRDLEEPNYDYDTLYYDFENKLSKSSNYLRDFEPINLFMSNTYYRSNNISFKKIKEKTFEFDSSEYDLTNFLVRRSGGDLANILYTPEHGVLLIKFYHGSTIRKVESRLFNYKFSLVDSISFIPLLQFIESDSNLNSSYYYEFEE